MRLALAVLIVLAGTSSAMADVFGVLAGTVQERTAGVDRVAQTLGVAFEKSRPKSNDYFDVLVSGRSRTVPELSSAEARVDRRSGRIRLLLLGVDPATHCTPSAEVIQRFGEPRDMAPPTARQPAGSPIFYTYRYPWGDLRVGVAPDRPQCVTTIVTEFND